MSLMIDSAPFIKAVKKLIKQKGITQAELAEQSELSRSQLSRLLSGKNRRVQQSTVDKIIAAFELSETEFSVLLASKQAADKTQSSPPTKTIYSDRLPTVVGQFVGRTAELKTLDQAWADPNINILQFIAPGGTGKTKLLREWINTQREKITSIIAWSFYSQGASTEKQISTSPFFGHALKALDSEQTTFNSDEDKGDHLATLLRNNECILILDGLEPLQHADAANRGELKDRALARLLKNLAGQPGTFCVITSRIAVYELSDRITVETHNLQNLEINDGLALLKSLGVRGREENLIKAVSDYAGHALALSLLGSLLLLKYRGDINKLETLPDLLENSGDKTNRHAFKVMQAYENWFAGTPELSLLYILGLFDHPVEIEALDALRNKEITGLTHSFQEADWFNAIQSLRNDFHILTDTDHRDKASQTLDCHPLIREYFGKQLEIQKPRSWQAAHECLYDYYKSVPVKELPDTLEEMRPLFYAIKHGCEAGLTQNAFSEVFWTRICRQNEIYLAMRLEAFSDLLAVTSHFFSKPWGEVRKDLSDENQTVLFASAMYCLNALGRSKEAIQPSKDYLNSLVEHKMWETVTQLSGILSKQQLILGYLHDAVETAQIGIKYSDNIVNPLEKIKILTLCAKALHQTGENKLALSLYKESEEIYTSANFDTPYLYATWGYYDLFLELGKIEAVSNKFQAQQNALKNEEASKPNALEMTMALLLTTHQMLQRKKYSKAVDTIELVVGTLKDSGRKDLIPLGLLTRAKIFVEIGDFTKGHQDLQEAYDIAHPSSMRLYLTDYHLEMSRLLLKQWQQQLLDDSAQVDIQEHLASAVKLIDETGYHRRNAEVEALIGPSQTTQHKQKKWSEEW